MQHDCEFAANRQFLASAATNVLSNAFTHTLAGGHVRLRARGTNGRVAIEVEDACGGIPETKADVFLPFGEGRARNRTGLGWDCRSLERPSRAQGGDIDVHNEPGKGCTFVIEVPAAAEAAAPIALGEPAL